MSLLNALGTGVGYLGDVGEKFGLRAVKGALTGHPRELLSPIPFSDTLGITDPSQRTSGAELATKLGIAREDDPFGQAAMGLGVDIALDPLTYAGGFGAARHLAKAPEAASAWSKIKALREPTTLVKQLGSFGGGERIIGNRLARAAMPGIDPTLADLAVGLHNVAPAQGRMISPWAEGALEPFRNFGFSRGGVPTERQELHHAILKNAALSGQYGGLNLPSQAVARTLGVGLRHESPLLMGLGEAGLETVGHGAEQRGLWPQLKEMARFTYSPTEHGLYHPQVAYHSPTAAALWHAAPGAVPGALAGAAGGAGAGYEESGVPGGLAGAALGGLGGAALGGLGSHLAYAPRKAGLLKALRGGGLGGESAALWGGWGKLPGYKQIKPELENLRSPIGRFKDLAAAAGIDFRVPRTEQEMQRFLGTMGRPPMAAYNLEERALFPNVRDYTKAWASNEGMSDLLRGIEERHRTRYPNVTNPYFSTPLRDQLALHEVTHGLHHAQGDITNPNYFEDINQLVKTKRQNPWDRLRMTIPQQVAEYGLTQPSEFVAEHNPRRLMAALAGQPEPATGPLADLYKQFRGPTNPPGLLDRFDRMYGGDLERALRGESQSLGLKYDQPPRLYPGQTRLPSPPEAHHYGLERSDPEWVNQRTFYHGTATPGLTKDILDPLRTSHANLYGKGIYTSDEAAFRPGLDITPGYAQTRAEEQKAKLASSMFARPAVEQAIASGRMPMGDLYRLMKEYGTAQRDLDYIKPGSNPALAAARAAPALNRMASQLERQGWNLKGNPVAASLVEALGGVPKGTPLIYQGQSDFGRILDLDKAASKKLKDIGRALLASRDVPINREAFERARTAGEHYNLIRQLEDQANLFAGTEPDPARYLRDLGYDAMTHTGGQRMGKDYHQVAIALDPKYKQWELYRTLAGQ